jgi:hypothetical protein
MKGLALDHVQVAAPAGGEAAARGGCWLALGSLQLHLGVDADFRAATKASVALRSDALADLQQRLADAGHMAIADMPVDGRARFFTANPFGNRIEFIAA